MVDENDAVKLLYYVNPDIQIPKELADKHTYLTSLDDLHNLICG